MQWSLIIILDLITLTMLGASLLRDRYARLLLQGHGHHRGPHSSVFNQLSPLAVSLDLELQCRMLKVYLCRGAESLVC